MLMIRTYVIFIISISTAFCSFGQEKTINIHGHIIDNETKVNLSAKIVVNNDSTDSAILTTYSDSLDGFDFNVSGKDKISINILLDNYLFHSESIDLNLILDEKSIEKNIELKKIVKGTDGGRIKYIFFDRHKTDLGHKDSLLVSEVAVLLKHNLKIKIVI